LPILLKTIKISWSRVDWCKFYIKIRNLNVPILIVEATGLKVWRRGHLHYWIIEFYKNPLIGLKVFGAHRRTNKRTDRQTKWWSHKSTFLFKEPRLKAINIRFRYCIWIFMSVSEISVDINKIHGEIRKRMPTQDDCYYSVKVSACGLLSKPHFWRTCSTLIATAKKLLLWTTAIFFRPCTQFGLSIELLHDTFATFIDLLANHWTKFSGKNSVLYPWS
jgi:hypothetical protein